MAENVGSISYDVEFNTGKLLDGQRKVESSLGRMTTAIKPVAIAVAGMTAAIAAAGIASAKAADNMRLLASRVEIAAGSVQAGAAAFDQLYRMSRDTNTSLEANAAVFNRLNQSILQMGGTQQDTLRLTDLLGKSMKISGASAAEASSAMLQFGQALGSGKLAGDELRSLLETAPALMRNLADGIGVPVGALKKLGEEGKLTSDVVIQAMGKAAEKIDSDFQKIPQTMEAAAASTVDALSRMNSSMDELSGGSAALTGVVVGLGEVVDILTGQITSLDAETAALQRKNAIRSWADSSINALSYVADAADVTWQTISVLGRNVSYVFESVGKEIGGIGAQVMAVLRGDFAGAKAIGDAMKSDSDARRKKLDAADKKSLDKRMTWGQKIRQQQAALELPGAGVMDAKDRNIQQVINQSFGKTVKPTAAAIDKKKKSGGQVFDSQGYIQGLVIANADGLAKIDAQEKDALDNAKKLLEEKKISQQQYQQAVTLIAQAAEADREQIRQKDAEDLQSWLDEQLRMEEEAANERQKAFESNRSAVDPLAALKAEYDAKLVLFDEYQAQLLERGIAAETDQQAAKAAITAEYDKQRMAMQEQIFASQSEANAFLIDSLNSLQGTAANALTGIMNGTMTAREAMASLASTIQQEAINALVGMGIQYVKNAIIAKTTTAATTAAQTAAVGTVTAANIAGTAASTSAAVAGAGAITAAAAPAAALTSVASFGTAAVVGLGALAATMVAAKAFGGGRQYGGAVNTDSFYRVGESGPEMFTASNGQNYMIPGQNGKVVPNGDLGGKVSVVVNNYASGVDVSANQNSNGDVEITVQRAVAEVASQISSNSGVVWSAMRSSTSIQSKL